MLLALALLLPAADPLAGRRPNVLLVLTDDQGYGDIARHGNPVAKTPHLDRLHDQSARLTDFHVSPTCSPTRAALMTGRHEFRSGVTHTIDERERLALSATTLAQVLKGAGYATGVFGKWHLGDEPAYQPDRRGFDEVFIHGAGGIGQTYPGSCGDAPGNRYFDPDILHNGRFERTRGYCTDVFFAQAAKWIDGVRGKRPFFAYVATNAPHAPLDCPEEYQARYPGQPADVARFYGMVSNIDDNLGRLLGKLGEWGIERDTLVVFMTDNGGTVGTKVFNAGMRAQKATVYRGGTRGVGFLRWPGTIPPGPIAAVTSHFDLFPTLAAVAGAKLPDGVPLDGRSLLPLLANPTADWPERTLFTHLGRWPRDGADAAKFANCSVRRGPYHLVSAVNKKAGKPPRWELFDLATDPGEKTDLAAAKPEVVRELAAAYDRWWAEVRPGLVNEEAYKTAPAENPFHTLYRRQFPGG